MSHAQDALAGLRRWSLERDDISDPGGRIYRDNQGNIFHSVTRILGKTAPEEQQKALQKWLERPGSEGDRALAAERGTLTHSHAEYLLKTANKLARQTANKRGAWSLRCTACGRSARDEHWGANYTCPHCGAVGASDGLERYPRSIAAWGLKKAVEGAPSAAWSAAGYARGLRHWILEHVTAIHAIEFSVSAPLRPRTDGTGLECYDPARVSEQSSRTMGFAGSADGLLDIDGTLSICDWKTTRKSAHSFMGSVLEQYTDQCGAYSIGLTERTGIQVDQAVIVLARRTGPPSVTLVRGQELRDAEQRFLQRCARYFASLTAGS